MLFYEKRKQEKNCVSGQTRKLAEMDVLDRLTCDVVTKVVKAKITAHVKETCQGSYTISHLTPLEDWLDDVVMRWIRFGSLVAQYAFGVHFF